MTQKQAEALLKEIQKKKLPLVATMEHVRPNQQYGWQVQITLQPQGWTLLAGDKEDWESIQQAWHMWLYGREAEVEEKEKRYLVDGIVMRVGKCQGYWYGNYRNSEGRYAKKYFGKIDPRGMYPTVDKEMELVK